MSHTFNLLEMIWNTCHNSPWERQVHKGAFQSMKIKISFFKSDYEFWFHAECLILWNFSHVFFVSFSVFIFRYFMTVSFLVTVSDVYKVKMEGNWAWFELWHSSFFTIQCPSKLFYLFQVKAKFFLTQTFWILPDEEVRQGNRLLLTMEETFPDSSYNWLIRTKRKFFWYFCSHFLTFDIVFCPFYGMINEDTRR